MWKGQVTKFKTAFDNYAEKHRKEKTVLCLDKNLSKAVKGFEKSKVLKKFAF